MAPEEPVLPVDDIQGDILAGFRKDHVRLIFFQFDSEVLPHVKPWLAAFAGDVSSARQVLGFNTAFKAMRLQMRREPKEMSVLWRNIAFTAAGLTKLVGSNEVAKFADTSFQSGADALSTTIGDPDDGSDGDRRTWLIGYGDKVPDGLIIVAADDEADLDAETDRLCTALKATTGKTPYVERGETRKTLPGHEHFGFKDGISQPALRGRYPEGGYITPRYLADTDPNAIYLAAPGQPLVWPGEFLLNQPQQKGGNSDPIDFKLVPSAPAWATNGSYLVFRRLRQNVAAFQSRVLAIQGKLSADPAFSRLSVDDVGALMVGRFQSGCPVMRSTQDNSGISADAYAANNFLFANDTPIYALRPSTPVRPDRFPPATADDQGVRCPYGAHIRKVNPRDESTDFGDGTNNLQKRLLRRGIPYGPEFNPAIQDQEDRGLLFLSYQSSIVNQFEFLMRDWVNGGDAPKSDSGFDPILSPRIQGQFIPRRPDGTEFPADVPGPAIVVATGAAYLFSPPISALRTVLAA